MTRDELGLKTDPHAYGRARAEANVTHCPQGHPYDEENTFITLHNTRNCLTCKKASVAAYVQSGNPTGTNRGISKESLVKAWLDNNKSIRQTSLALDCNYSNVRNRLKKMELI